jgi:hypothetical protein
MAVRLATIRAIGRSRIERRGPDRRHPLGLRLAMWSAQRMIADAADYMVETEHQGRALEVLRHIRAAQERVPHPHRAEPQGEAQVRGRSAAPDPAVA